MAIEIHNVEAGDVLDELPIPTDAVTSSSSGLNTGKIDRWIKTSAGILNALLERNGIDPTDLDANATEVVRDGIISYAVSKCLRSRDFDEDDVQAHWNAWKEARRVVREMSGDLGDSDKAQSVQSNIDTQAGESTGWGADFNGW